MLDIDQQVFYNRIMARKKRTKEIDLTLSEKQKRALEAVYRGIADNGYAPSFADLREELKVVSNQSVLNFLDVLEKKGCIKREGGVCRNIARGIKILPLGFKALGIEQKAAVEGTSSAGYFAESFAESVLDKWMTLPGELIKNEKIKLYDNEVFIIRVFGDSMINAGISSGDFLLVKKCSDLHSGDIVVARGDDGTTVKRFVKDKKSGDYLKPENPAYKNIPIFDGMSVDGKVVFNLSKGRRIK